MTSVQQAARRLDTHLPVTLVYGAAARLRQRIIARLVDAKLPPEEREWGLTVLDAAELGAEGVANQLVGVSLMAQARVIVVRNVEKLPGSAQKVLVRAVRHLPPETYVVLDVECGEEYQRKGPPLVAELRQACEQVGQVVEASTPADRELPQWIVEEAAAQGKTMPLAAAQAFVATVGSRIDLMLNELDKLVLYIGPQRKEITIADVRAVVTGEREDSVFELVDAIGRRDAQRALAALPCLLPPTSAQGAAIGLLGMIARQLRLIWQAKALTTAGISAQTTSLPPAWEDRLPREQNWVDTVRGRQFMVRKYEEQARNFSDVQLVRALVKVYETDLALKGQTEERMDERLALETLIVSLCRL